LEAARLLLQRLGISPADLVTGQPARPLAPTFAEYVPVVAGAVSAASRRAYGSYWDRVVLAWGKRRLDTVRASEIEQLRAQVQAVRPIPRRRNEPPWCSGGRCQGGLYSPIPDASEGRR